jgi:hypothetical protein
MDNELFTLCKQVYEKTGWKNTGKAWYSINGKVHDRNSVHVDGEIFDKLANVPLYTSDYLLQKLGDLDQEVWLMRCIHQDGSRNWCVTYKNTDYFFYEDRTITALLKLTLALAEAGELK